MQLSKLSSISHGNSLNAKLIDNMKSYGTIRSAEVEKVMRSIDRGEFSISDPYVDQAQYIGYSATISAPHMHAYALESLKDHLKTAKKSLDIGSGSGYLTLAFWKLMEDPYAVSYGVEHIPKLVKESIANIEKSDSSLIKNGKIVMKEGDGRKGLKEFAPYDCIHVGAATQTLPNELLDQLAPGGRMVIPIGIYFQDFVVVDKGKDGKITQQSALEVEYAPLTSKEKQWPK